jgi:hypothetical protein
VEEEAEDTGVAAAGRVAVAAEVAREPVGAVAEEAEGERESTGEEEEEIVPRWRGQDKVLGVFGRVGAVAVAAVVDVHPWRDPAVLAAVAATLRHRADLLSVQLDREVVEESAPEEAVVAWQVGCQVSAVAAGVVEIDPEYPAVGKACLIVRQQGQVPVLGVVVAAMTS